MFLRLLVGQALGQGGGLLQGRFLRSADLLGIALESVGRLGTGLAANQLPGGVDDFLLKLRELLGVAGVLSLALLLLLLLLLAAGGLLPLAKDLFEGPHFGEV